MPSKRKKKWGKKSKKRGEERKRKVKVKTACFLHMLELCKLIFCIWIRSPWSVWPVNGFVVSFSSLQYVRQWPENHSITVASKRVCFAKSPGLRPTVKHPENYPLHDCTSPSKLKILARQICNTKTPSLNL